MGQQQKKKITRNENLPKNNRKHLQRLSPPFVPFAAWQLQNKPQTNFWNYLAQPEPKPSTKSLRPQFAGVATWKPPKTIHIHGILHAEEGGGPTMDGEAGISSSSPSKHLVAFA